MKSILNDGTSIVLLRYVRPSDEVTAPLAASRRPRPYPTTAPRRCLYELQTVPRHLKGG